MRDISRFCLILQQILPYQFVFILPLEYIKLWYISGTGSGLIRFAYETILSQGKTFTCFLKLCKIHKKAPMSETAALL